MLDSDAKIQRENPGEKHSVVREIVVSRRAISTDDFDESEIDFGEPTDAETLIRLQSIATDYTQEFFQKYSGHLKIDNESLLILITDLINKNFFFLNQGTGVATIKKQLAHYEKLHEKVAHDVLNADVQVEMAGGLDCKLATVMTGLVTDQVSERMGMQSKTQLMTKANGAHPSLIISFSKDNLDEDIYIVDAHNVIPNRESLGGKSMTFEEQLKWERINARSAFTVRPLDEIGRIVLKKNFIHLGPLTVDELAHLDELFIKS